MTGLCRIFQSCTFMSPIFSLPHECTFQRILTRFLFVINVRNEPPEQPRYKRKHHMTKLTSYTLWMIWSWFVTDMVVADMVQGHIAFIHCYRSSSTVIRLALCHYKLNTKTGHYSSREIKSEQLFVCNEARYHSTILGSSLNTQSSQKELHHRNMQCTNGNTLVTAGLHHAMKTTDSFLSF